MKQLVALCKSTGELLVLTPLFPEFPADKILDEDVRGWTFWISAHPPKPLAYIVEHGATRYVMNEKVEKYVDILGDL